MKYLMTFIFLLLLVVGCDTIVNPTTTLIQVPQDTLRIPQDTLDILVSTFTVDPNNPQSESYLWDIKLEADKQYYLRFEGMIYTSEFINDTTIFYSAWNLYFWHSYNIPNPIDPGTSFNQFVFHIDYNYDFSRGSFIPPYYNQDNLFTYYFRVYNVEKTLQFGLNPSINFPQTSYFEHSGSIIITLWQII